MFALFRVFSSVRHYDCESDNSTDRHASVGFIGLYSSQEDAHIARQQIVDKELRLGAKLCDGPSFGHSEEGADAVHVDVHPGQVLSLIIVDSSTLSDSDHGVLVFGGSAL